ncbi:MAG: HAD family hydrolase [Bacteroidia bacterium]
MIISFDLDNTLIPYSNEFEVIRPAFAWRLLGAESLRKGTVPLFSKLRDQGHSIWIYTTSYRSVASMRVTFRAAGLAPDRFINEHINQKLLKAHNCKASKHAGLFEIDLHIDDSEGVVMEGRSLGFQALRIDTEDQNWEEKVLTQVRLLMHKFH